MAKVRGCAGSSLLFPCTTEAESQSVCCQPDTDVARSVSRRLLLQLQLNAPHCSDRSSIAAND